MKKIKWLIFILAVLTLPVALTGCWWSKNQMSLIDPPPNDLGVTPTAKMNPDANPGEKPDVKPEEPPKRMDEPSSNPKAPSKNDQSSSAQLYFLSDSGYVVPHTVKMDKQNAPIKNALTKLVDGNMNLPKGYVGALPKGTKVQNIKLSEGTATIDLSSEFLNYNAKLESKMLDAITWSLTGLPGVKSVNLSVNGKALEVMPKGKSQAYGLTRNRGINLEVTKGVNPTDSMPVVLYFLAQSSDNRTYYVPITRMVHQSDNLAQATLSELIRGPELYSKLINVVDTSTDVNSVKVSGDLARVDFGDQLLQYGKQKSISKNALDAIVLSLTENTGVKQVKITVNGNGNVSVFGQNLNVSKPVTRPTFINADGV